MRYGEGFKRANVSYQLLTVQPPTHPPTHHQPPSLPIEAESRPRIIFSESGLHSLEQKHIFLQGSPLPPPSPQPPPISPTSGTKGALYDNVQPTLHNQTRGNMSLALVMTVGVESPAPPVTLYSKLRCGGYLHRYYLALHSKTLLS